MPFKCSSPALFFSYPSLLGEYVGAPTILWLGTMLNLLSRGYRIHRTRRIQQTKPKLDTRALHCTANLSFSRTGPPGSLDIHVSWPHYPRLTSRTACLDQEKMADQNIRDG